MKWKEIEKNYPKSFEKMLEFEGVRGGADHKLNYQITDGIDFMLMIEGDNQQWRTLKTRDLYNFFDNHYIHLSVIPFCYECGIPLTWHSDWTWNILWHLSEVEIEDILDREEEEKYLMINNNSRDIEVKSIKDDTKFPIRLRAEEAGFKRCFELLEERIFNAQVL